MGVGVGVGGGGRRAGGTSSSVELGVCWREAAGVLVA